MGAYTSERITGKPLYCFKYNEETGEITKIEILVYTLETHYWTGKKTYCFDKPKINKSYTHEVIAEGKLDRYVSGKVFTFNPNLQYVKRIILETLTAKYYKLEDERLKLRDAVEEFLRANPEFDNEEYEA